MNKLKIGLLLIIPMLLISAENNKHSGLTYRVQVEFPDDFLGMYLSPNNAYHSLKTTDCGFFRVNDEFSRMLFGDTLILVAIGSIEVVNDTNKFTYSKNKQLRYVGIVDDLDRFNSDSTIFCGTDLERSKYRTFRISKFYK